MSNVLPFSRPDDAKAPTVSKIVEAYLEDARTELPPKTWDQRQRYARRFASAFGARPYDSIRPSEVKQWLLGVEEWGDTTRSTVLCCLKRVFNWAVNDRMTTFNPLRGLTVQRGNPRRATTEDEFQGLLRASGAACFRLLLVFLRACGCRPGEAASLRFEWIDWELRCAVIPANRHKTGKKTGKPRLIPLPATAIKMLRLLQRQRADQASGVIFLNSRGHPWTRSSMSLRMTIIRAATGIDPEATLHGIRHLWACQGLANTSDLKGVSRALGHDRVQTTEASYLHLRRQEIDELVRIAEQAARRH